MAVPNIAACAVVRSREIGASRLDTSCTATTERAVRPRTTSVSQTLNRARNTPVINADDDAHQRHRQPPAQGGRRLVVEVHEEPQVAGRPGDEVRDGQPQQMPQVVGGHGDRHLAAAAGHRGLLQRAQPDLQHRRQDEGDEHGVEPLHGAVDEVLVDEGLGQPGDHHAGERQQHAGRTASTSPDRASRSRRPRTAGSPVAARRGGTRGRR